MPERADAESELEQQESQARLERGQIPLGAERRLRELGERGGSFTSDLSVADFALCHQLGLRPLSQVMGSSIYQVGYQATPWQSMQGVGFAFELATLSQAWNEVRERAFGRLAQEAAAVGASAVVGVEIRTDEHDWAENAVEYVVVGTAVRHGSDAPPAHPVLTELSVADYSKLMRAGIEPLGVVAWSSAFYVAASYATQSFGGGYMQNQELREFTQGVYSARETVVQRLTAQAASVDASGVIGVRIGHGIRPLALGGGPYGGGRGLMVTFHAVGTAIRETAHTSWYAPEPTIDLTSNKQAGANLQ